MAIQERGVYNLRGSCTVGQCSRGFIGVGGRDAMRHKSIDNGV